MADTLGRRYGVLSRWARRPQPSRIGGQWADHRTGYDRFPHVGRRRSMRTALTLIVVLTLGTIAATAQGHGGAMGVWVLNLQKSTFEPGPLPKMQTSTFTLLPGGAVKIENDSVDVSGRSSHRE